MAVARFAVKKPIANATGLDAFLYEITRTSLTSIVAVNTSGFTKISAWIVPDGEDAAPENWIPYIDNIDLTSRNTFETFKIAVNLGDKIYASSVSGEVTFFINGIYDIEGRANVTVGEQEPDSPQVGDVWIRSDLDPQQVYFWAAAISEPAQNGWQPLGSIGPAGPANDLTIGTVETGEFGDPAEVTITGDSPDQVLNFVLPPGQQGPSTTLTIGTVTTSAPGEDAEVEVTGTSPDQTINFVLPRGETGPQGPDGLPTQTDNEGKYLTTDGTDAFWETVDALPDQTGNEGKYLTTDGTDPEWAFLSGGSAADEPPTTGLVDGSIWLDTDGDILAPNGRLIRWVKTATAGQTIFSGASDVVGTTLTYKVASEQVFLNGVQLVRGSDYTGSDGIEITLIDPAAAGDVVQIITIPFTETTSNAITESYFEQKGDLITALGANEPIILNSPGIDGQVLTVNTTTPTGLEWTTPTPDSSGNAIINGAFDINQRGFTSTTANTTFTFDRWFTRAVDGTSTFAAQSFTPGSEPVGGDQGRNYINITTSGQSISSARTAIGQTIESVRTFAGQTVILSFWAKSNSGTPSIAAYFGQNFGNGGSPSTGVDTAGQKVSITTSWNRYSLEFEIPSISGKTLGTSNDDRLVLFLLTSASSDWNFQTNSLGIQSTSIDIWGVQLEAGPVATPFRRNANSLQGELAACQRYYYRISSTGTDLLAWGAAYTTTTARYSVPFPVTMRIKPTALEQSGTASDYGIGISGVASVTCTGAPSFSAASVNLATFNASIPASMTAYHPVTIDSRNSNAYLAWSAEL